MSKKVRDLLIDESPQGLLRGGALQTRKGLLVQPNSHTKSIVVKTLPSQTNLTEFYLQYFTFIQSIDCPYLLKALKFQKTQSNHYFAFQRYPTNLTKLMQVDILNLLDCCTRALQVLERSGSIHGNLKPSNIFYHERNFLLGDHYGFKWLIKQDIHREQFLVLAANLNLIHPENGAYLSPEVILDSKDYSIKSDIYALGIIGTEVVSRADKTIRSSETIQHLLRRMIEVDPDKRVDLAQLISTIRCLLEQQQSLPPEVSSFSDDLFYRDNNLIQGILTSRSRAQFYHTVIDIILIQFDQLKLLQLSEVYLNCFVFHCHLTILQAYKTCYNSLEDHEDPHLVNMVHFEHEQYIIYFSKVLRLFSNYVRDLQLSLQVTPQRTDYVLWYQTITTLLKQCSDNQLPQKNLIYDILSTLKNEIVQKNSIRRAKLGDNLQEDTVYAINLILLLNKVEYFLFVNQDLTLLLNYNKIHSYSRGSFKPKNMTAFTI